MGNIQKPGSNLFQQESVGSRWQTTKHVDRSNQKPQHDLKQAIPAVIFIPILTGNLCSVTLTYTDIQYMYMFSVSWQRSSWILYHEWWVESWPPGIWHRTSDLTASGTPPKNNRRKFSKGENLYGWLTHENTMKVDWIKENLSKTRSLYC